MLNNQLPIINNDDIKLTPATITFNNAGAILASAQRLNDQLIQVEVTEENLKESKRLVAQVRKAVNNLEDIRKGIKREILKPYEDFEVQVKEITSEVKKGEDLIRAQTRELEEHERDAKQAQLEDMIDKRSRHYPLLTKLAIPSDKLIERYHLNKSTSFDKAESEIVAKMTQVEQDLGVVESLPNAPEILLEYSDSLNLSHSIMIVQERLAKEAKIAETLETITPTPKAMRVTISEAEFKLLNAQAKLLDNIMDVSPNPETVIKTFNLTDDEKALLITKYIK